MKKLLLFPFLGITIFGLILIAKYSESIYITFGVMLVSSGLTLLHVWLNEPVKRYKESLTEMNWHGVEIRAWKNELGEPDFKENRREIIAVLTDVKPHEVGLEGVCDKILTIDGMNAVQAYWKNKYNPGNSVVIYKNWP